MHVRCQMNRKSQTLLLIGHRSKMMEERFLQVHTLWRIDEHSYIHLIVILSCQASLPVLTAATALGSQHLGDLQILDSGIKHVDL